MTVPTNKKELQIAITTNYEKLKKELFSIPVELSNIQDLEGHSKGTLISINNLVSYLIGWGELVLKWNKLKDQNQIVNFPETGFKWNELGKLAQKFYDDYKEIEFESLIEKLDFTVQNILFFIDKKSNSELYGVAWYDKWTLGRMIQFNTSSPYTNARGRIRKWKKEKGMK